MQNGKNDKHSHYKDGGIDPRFFTKYFKKYACSIYYQVMYNRFRKARKMNVMDITKMKETAAGAAQIFGGFGAAALQNRWNKEQMEYQHELNEISAANAAKRAKEMWDYTNYENQVKHMKEAGLNPALLYGQNGGGGTTSNVGHGMGVGTPQGNTASNIVAGMQNSMEARQVESQIAVNNSIARKNNTEANAEEGWKKALVETQTQAEEQRIDVFKTLANLQTAKADEAYANCMTLGSQAFLFQQQATALDLQNTVNEATAEAQISRIINDNFLVYQKGLSEIANRELTEEQTEQIGVVLKQAWKRLEIDERNAASNEANAESNKSNAESTKAKVKIEAEKTAAQIKYMVGDLDYKETMAAQGWTFGFLNAGLQLMDQITDIIPGTAVAKGVAKGFGNSTTTTDTKYNIHGRPEQTVTRTTRGK